MSRRERTPEEREAARLERARRRAEREGRPFRPEEHALPPMPPPPVERPPAPPEAPAAGDPADGAAPAPVPPSAPARPAEPAPAAAPPRAVPDREDAAPPPPAHAAEPAAEDAAAVGPPAHDPEATQPWDVTVDWQDVPPAPRTPLAADLAAGPAAPAADDRAVPAADDAAAAEAAQVHPAAPDHARPAVPPVADDAAPVDPPVADDGVEVPLGTRRVPGGRRRAGRAAARPRRRRARARMRRPGELGPPRRRPTGRRWVAGGALALVVVALGWFLVELLQPFHDGAGSGRVVVTIPAGADAGDIGALLADRGVVDSGFFFNLRATLGGDRGSLRSGRHVLRRGMSYAAALDALTAAPAVQAPPTITLTIPEGRSRREAAALVRRAGLRGDYVAATRRARGFDPRRYGAPRDATLEGFLFPATYELPRGARVQRLVSAQLRAFEQNIRRVDLRRARRANLTAYDVLIIASMIEREVTLPRERPLVAAVIYNRLRQGIPLGIDATLRYERNDWVNPLRQSVLEADTPFNTRIRPGLPPSPIGSPGLASIRAAARPARVNYTYYVVDPCSRGAHAFATTYEEHLANVARYDRARAAAGGNGLRC